MKKIILTLALTMAASPAFALGDFSKKMDLCVLQTSEDSEEYSKTFDETFFYVNKAQKVTRAQLQMINQHLIQQEYVSEPLTLKQIKALFTTGEQQYNDLYFITLVSKPAGTKYYYVKSYPGDNPYGLIFTADGKLAAYNQDDNITLIDGVDTFECPWK